jgi:hypothetical protein
VDRSGSNQPRLYRFQQEDVVYLPASAAAAWHTPATQGQGQHSQSGTGEAYRGSAAAWQVRQVHRNQARALRSLPLTAQH